MKRKNVSSFFPNMPCSSSILKGWSRIGDVETSARGSAPGRATAAGAAGTATVSGRAWPPSLPGSLGMQPKTDYLKYYKQARPCADMFMTTTAKCYIIPHSLMRQYGGVCYIFSWKEKNYRGPVESNASRLLLSSFLPLPNYLISHWVKDQVARRAKGKDR